MSLSVDCWEVASSDVDRFRSLVHNAASILLLLDDEGTVLSVSAAITRLLGQDQELVEGNALLDIADANDQADLRSALRRAVESRNPNEGPTVVEVRLMSFDRFRSVPFELTIVNPSR